MKRFVLVLIALLTVFTFVKAEKLPVNYQWAHSVDGNTKGGDMIVGMTMSSDGNYYVATTFGTSNDEDDALNVWFDGEKLYNSKNKLVTGSSYVGTSQNGNLLLQKVDKEGNVLWNMYTLKGDVEHAATKMVPTSDGGVVMAIKTRAWVEAEGLTNLSSIYQPGKRGLKYVITDDLTKPSEYRYVILKITSKGVVDWYQIIRGEVREDTKYATKNNAYVYGLTIDENDNIYVAGNFRTKLWFQDAQNKWNEIDAQNTKDWNGDSQAVTGDLFLVKLNKQGLFLNSFLADGTAKCAFIDNLCFDDGKLYLNGRVQGDGTEMKLGGFKVDASSDRQTEILASINASDLSVNYVKSLESVANTDNRFVIQNKSVQLLNGKLYYTGLLNGSWKQDGQTLLDNPSSKMLKGYVLQVDPATGHVDNAAIRLDGGIGGFFGVYEGEKNLYAFGFDFTSGAILAPISKDKFTLGTATKICSYGTVGICTTPIVDGENFVLAHRGGVARNFSNKASFYGTDFKFDNLKCWGTVYYSYKMGDVMTGVDKVTVDMNDDALVDVYTLNGMKVKSGVSAAEATQGLAKGIYIINHKKVVVK